MRRFGCLGIVVALLVIGFAYQTYSLAQLRGQVQRMSGKVQVSAVNGKRVAEKPDLVSSLAQTEKHAARARELLRQKRFQEAQKELDMALKGLQAARGVSGDIVGDAAELLGKARENAQQVFKKAWKDISEETKRK